MELLVDSAVHLCFLLNCGRIGENFWGLLQFAFDEKNAYEGCWLKDFLNKHLQTGIFEEYTDWENLLRKVCLPIKDSLISIFFIYFVIDIVVWNFLISLDVCSNA